MNKQLVTWQFIDKSLRQNVPVMLLYVLESNGSKKPAGWEVCAPGLGGQEYRALRDRMNKNRYLYGVRRLAGGITGPALTLKRTKKEGRPAQICFSRLTFALPSEGL